MRTLVTDRRTEGQRDRHRQTDGAGYRGPADQQGGPKNLL